MTEEYIYPNHTMSSPGAFLIYRPEVKITKEVVFQNQEATKILTYQSPSARRKESFPDTLALCAKWKNLLKRKFKKMVESGNESVKGEASAPIFLEMIRSGRRRYVVKGMVLFGKKSENEKEANYVFLLDRVCLERVNVPLIAQQWRLSPREQDVVRLLLEDRGNKEMAHLLGLSINTVKVYLKLLMRKLNVSSRAGIVSCLLTKEPVARGNKDSLISAESHILS